MVPAAFEWLVAFRYLRARRQEGFISVVAWFSFLGITLGVATLIIVMAVMNGFRQELLTRILGLNGHIEVSALVSGPLKEFDALAHRLREIDGIEHVVPVVQGQVLVSANGISQGALVRGLRGRDLAVKHLLAKNLVAGSLDGFDEGSGLLVGYRMARRFALLPGDKLTLIAPQGTPTAFGTMPRMKAYRVAGIFDVGMSQYDAGFVFMPLAAAQVLFRMEGGVSVLEVDLADPEAVSVARQAILDAAGPTVRIRDWQQINHSFFTALKVERNVMFLILTLIILVAAFNIISSQVMLVKDKGRGIAILRTMGATKGMVLRIFFITGASVGVIGTVVGAALGIAFAANIETIRQLIQKLIGIDLFQAEIYFLSQLPAEIDPTEVAMVIAMALVLSFLASIYPAWRAARLDPVEVLRYE